MVSPPSWERCLRRARTGDPLRVGVAGAGFLGRGLILQVGCLPGLEVVAVADRHPERIDAALALHPAASPAAVADGPEDVRAIQERGAVAVMADPRWLAAAAVDVIVDCTGDPDVGAALAWDALHQDVPFVAGAELDATVGPALAEVARRRGVAFGGGGGDEPGEVMGLVRQAEQLGLEVVAAGKFKQFLDPAATPESVLPWARRHRQNPHMLASFADGTKMNLEMAVVANATGLVPDVPGMHCPTLERAAIADALHAGAGGILAREGVVEVVCGAEPSSSVFVVARARHPAQQADLEYLKLGAGPRYLLHKPYHLCALELAPSLVGVVIDGTPSVTPRGAPVAQVNAVAKRDLPAGTQLDRIGGRTFHGRIVRADGERAATGLPAGLAHGRVLRRPVRAGRMLTFADVEARPETRLEQLHAWQRSGFLAEPGDAYSACGTEGVRPGR